MATRRVLAALGKAPIYTVAARPQPPRFLARPQVAVMISLVRRPALKLPAFGRIGIDGLSPAATH
jgi:hypothetical protein